MDNFLIKPKKPFDLMHVIIRWNPNELNDFHFILNLDYSHPVENTST